MQCTCQMPTPTKRNLGDTTNFTFLASTCAWALLNCPEELVTCSGDQEILSASESLLAETCICSMPGETGC